MDVTEIGLFIFSKVAVQRCLYNYKGCLYNYKSAHKKIYVMLHYIAGSTPMDKVHCTLSIRFCTITTKKCHHCRFLVHFGLRNGSGFSKLVTS